MTRTPVTTAHDPRAERRRQERRERRQRITREQQSAAALATLRTLARQERQRSAAARALATIDDIASDTFVRLSEHDSDTLAALAADDDTAGARARMVTRSVVSHLSDAATVVERADAPAEAPTMASVNLSDIAEGVGQTMAKRSELLPAALDADGQASRADRDIGRSHAMTSAALRGTLAAGDAERERADHGAAMTTDRETRATVARQERAQSRRTQETKRERRRVPHINEQTSARRADMGEGNTSRHGSVRIIREAPLDSLLSDAMRPDPDRTIDHGAAIDRVWSGCWQRTVSEALASHNIGGRRGTARAALARSVERCEQMTAEQERAHRALLAACVMVWQQEADRTDERHALLSGATLSALHRDATRAERELESRWSVNPAAASALLFIADAVGSAEFPCRTDEGKKRAPTAAEVKSARAALLAAEQERDAAREALSIWRTVTDDGQRPFTLSGALLASVDTARNATDRSETSAIHWSALASAIGSDRSKSGLRALRTLVRDAVSSAVVTDGIRASAGQVAALHAAQVGREQRERQERQVVRIVARDLARGARSGRESLRQEYADELDNVRRTFRGHDAKRAAKRAAKR